MATSPNYGWLEPDNTDLVKNGALAIRTLGNAIDTTMATMTPKSIVDAKGDLIAASAADTPARLAVGADGETLVADSLTSTGLRYQSNFAAGKNKIINGSFDIAQRGTFFAGGQYGLDRFRSGSGSNLFTITQEAGIGGSRYAAKLTQTGSNSFTQFGTQIEFANCYDLQNETITISFVAQANNTNSGSTAFTVRTRTLAGVDVACLFTGTAINTSITLTTTATRYTVTRTLPATFGSLSLEFSTGAGVTGDGYTITNIQMERGSVATAFTRAGGTIQGELAACQRYYYRQTTATNYGNLHGVGVEVAATSGWFNHFAPTTMRVKPSSVDYSALKVSNATTSFAITALSLNANNADGSFFMTDWTSASGGTANRPCILQANNNSAAYIGFSAEL